MTYLRKTVQVKSIKVHIDPQEMYHHIMVGNANKKIPTFRMASLELHPVPLSMLTCITDKSEYMHK